MEGASCDDHAGVRGSGWNLPAVNSLKAGQSLWDNCPQTLVLRPRGPATPEWSETYEVRPPIGLVFLLEQFPSSGRWIQWSPVVSVNWRDIAWNLWRLNNKICEAEYWERAAQRKNSGDVPRDPSSLVNCEPAHVEGELREARWNTASGETQSRSRSSHLPRGETCWLHRAQSRDFRRIPPHQCSRTLLRGTWWGEK